MSAPAGRLLTLLSLLQVRREWSGEELAGRLDVSTRTVRRDVDRLRELGYPVEAAKGPDGGYRLGAGEALPPLLFDNDQAVALVVALQLAAAPGSPFADGAARALATVRQVLPASLRSQIDVLAVHRGRWYLVAWDLDRRAWRTFRLDRVVPRANRGPTFTRRQLPGGDIYAFLATRLEGRTSAGVWPCVGEVILARSVAEVAPLLPDGDAEAMADGRCRVWLGSWSWAGLVGDLARFECEVEVVGPAALRRAVGEAAERFTRAALSSARA